VTQIQATLIARNARAVNFFRPKPLFSTVKLAYHPDLHAHGAEIHSTNRITDTSAPHFTHVPKFGAGQ
jgi:hypothetical protein